MVAVDAGATQLHISMPFAAGAVIESGSKKTVLTVTGDVGYPVHGNTTLQVKTLTNINYIITDKPIYKPGQTVKARVFGLTPKLHAAKVVLTIMAKDPQVSGPYVTWMLCHPRCMG